MFESVNLISPMDEVIDVVGDPIKGAGWYGHTTGIHTVAIKVANFRGRISVQASIVTAPSSDSDWFSVLPGAVAYLQYPQNGYVIVPPTLNETSTIGFNFTANVVWVRALVTRSYFIPPQSNGMYISTFGQIDYILLNY